MPKRTTIELDEELIRQAREATGLTLRATVERGLRMVIEESGQAATERRRLLDDHLSSMRERLDKDVLLSDEAWR